MTNERCQLIKHYFCRPPELVEACLAADRELGDWEIAISKFPNSTFPNHSVLKLFTGFAIAAFIAWKLTVINVMANAPNPEAMNTQNDIVVL